VQDLRELGADALEALEVVEPRCTVAEVVAGGRVEDLAGDVAGGGCSLGRNSPARIRRRSGRHMRPGRRAVRQANPLPRPQHQEPDSDADEQRHQDDRQIVFEHFDHHHLHSARARRRTSNR
jgi:hypothetical protein